MKINFFAKLIRDLRYDLFLLFIMVILMLQMLLDYSYQNYIDSKIIEAQEELNKAGQGKEQNKINADIKKYKENAQYVNVVLSSNLTYISLFIAITSIMVCVDGSSKWTDFKKNYPKLLLKTIIIKENDNPKTDWKEYENVGAMDISDFKELYYIDLTKSQYKNYVKGKYIPSGQSVSFSNSISDEECIFRYIQIAATVEHKYVVLSDGYYQLERQEHNKYVVIQKSLNYYYINKKVYDKIETVHKTKANKMLFNSYYKF